MKLKSTFTLLGSVTALMAGPVLYAGGGVAAQTPEILEPAFCMPFEIPQPTICEPVELTESEHEDGDESGEAVENELGGQEEELIEPEVVENEDSEEGEIDGTTDENSETVDEEVTEPEEGVELVEDTEEYVIPIEWLKRGGLENPEIMMFQTTALGGGAAAVVSQAAVGGALSREMSQDEKASAIEVQKGSANLQIQSEKKEPVALIKQGRVFLR